MLSQTLIASQHPKILEILRNCGVAMDKMGLEEEALQRVVHRAGELKKGVVDLVVSLSLIDQYADQQVASTWIHPPEHTTGPKPIEEQIATLAEMFDLDPTSALEYVAKSLPQLPEGAEGWFAIPSPVALAAKHFPGLVDPAKQYCAGVNLILSKIAASRKCHNYRKGQITTAQLRVANCTAESLVQITKNQQQGGILIIAAQLILRRLGEPIYRAHERFVADEFGLGSLVFSVVLTHPEWFIRWVQLQIDCADDEFSPWVDDELCYAPCFSLAVFSDGEVVFSSFWICSALAVYGSTSDFLPQ